MEDRKCMKKDMKPITEEELAAYIDGSLSASRLADVEASLTDDRLELLGVTRAAVRKVPGDKGAHFPGWKDVPASSVPVFRLHNPLAMAGFLGDEEGDDMAVDVPENEKGSRSDREK